MEPEDTLGSAPEGVEDDGMVEVHEASIEDLDAALESAKELEEVPEAPPADDSAAPANPSPAPTQQSPDGQPVPDAQASGQNVVPSGADASKPRFYTQEEVQAILADNERQKKEGNQKELFIQQRGNELGLLRKELNAERQNLIAVRAQLANGIEDRASENPLQAMNDQKKIDQIDSQLEGLDGKEVRASRIVEAQTFFLQHVDTNKVSLQDVAEVLKSDGMDDRYVAQFVANPWEFTTPEALVQFGKRAMDKKEFIVANNDRHILAKEVLRLTGMLNQSNARPAQVMRQVQRNINQHQPTVTAASASSPRSAREVDPTKMSDRDLNAALEHALRH